MHIHNAGRNIHMGKTKLVERNGMDMNREPSGMDMKPKLVNNHTCVYTTCKVPRGPSSTRDVASTLPLTLIRASTLIRA